MSQKPDPFEIEGLKRPTPKASAKPALFFALVALVLGGVILTPIPEKIRRKLGLATAPVAAPAEKTVLPAPDAKVVVQEKIVEKIVKIRPAYYQVKDGTDVAKASAGFDFKTEVAERPGRLTSAEREDEGTYEAFYRLTVKRPEAAKQFDEVLKVNPELGKILPGLEVMMARPKVSPFFKNLYDNKFARLKTYANRFDRLLTKHNYYDCQTMLELEHPGSKRKAFLMQADMDVVSDGSDGDRLATMPDKIVNSSYYQPFTSYGWKKTGTVENPMIAGWRKQLATAKTKGNASEVKRLETGIKDLQKRSFLIAEYDPFIVIPVDVILDRESAWGPNVGDYAAVIYGKDVYPAIVGDGGPPFKVGEASLRMAQALNEKATPYNRPVSDVSVTYLVFPRSSGDWVEPNYETWHSECAKLLAEIGGLGEGYELHQWENTFPSAEPEPEPEPAPAATATEPSEPGLPE